MNVESQVIEQANINKEKTASRSLDEWHCIFGHLHNQGVEMLYKNGMVKGMEITLNTNPISECCTCIEAKTTRYPVPKESHSKYENIGDLIFSDVWGPAQVTGIRNEKYFISFTDAKKHHTNLYFMENKGEALEHFWHYHALIKTQLKNFVLTMGKSMIINHSGNIVPKMELL